MRIIALLVVVFGIALAGGAMLFASKYFQAYEESLARQNKAIETVRVIAAKVPLRFGQSLKASDLKWVDWPKAALPEGAITSDKVLFGERQEIKRTVTRAMEVGEPILQSKLSGFGDSDRMASQIAEGKRAVSILIDAVTGVGGFVAPGDRVDIILTRTVQGVLTTNALLQDILVIAVDQRSSSEANAPRIGRTATVEVDAVQAQKLALAQQVGKLSLTLRGTDAGLSAHEEPTKSVNVNDLIDLPPAPPPVVEPEKPAAPVQNTVRVRKGGAVETVPVQ